MRNANLPNQSKWATVHRNGKKVRVRRMLCIGGPLNGKEAAIHELPAGEYHIMNFGGYVSGAGQQLRREYSGSLFLHYTLTDDPEGFVVTVFEDNCE